MLLALFKKPYASAFILTFLLSLAWEFSSSCYGGKALIIHPGDEVYDSSKALRGFPSLEERVVNLEEASRWNAPFPQRIKYEDGKTIVRIQTPESFPRADASLWGPSTFKSLTSLSGEVPPEFFLMIRGLKKLAVNYQDRAADARHDTLYHIHYQHGNRTLPGCFISALLSASVVTPNCFSYYAEQGVVLTVPHQNIVFAERKDIHTPYPSTFLTDPGDAARAYLRLQEEQQYGIRPPGELVEAGGQFHKARGIDYDYEALNEVAYMPVNPATGTQTTINGVYFISENPETRNPTQTELIEFARRESLPVLWVSKPVGGAAQEPASE